MTTAFHFEAKKYALRQAKDGVIVSFVVHPNDVVAELLSAPIGEHYVVALAPYTETAGVAQKEDRLPCKQEAAGSIPAVGPTPHEKRPKTPAEWAGMLCNDVRFQKWAGQPSAEAAADMVRRVCGIRSRSEINTNARAAALWNAMHNRYRQETGLDPWTPPTPSREADR